MTKYNLHIFSCLKGPSNDHVMGARGTVVQEIRPGAGLETGDFVKKKKLGGGYRRKNLRYTKKDK